MLLWVTFMISLLVWKLNTNSQVVALHTEPAVYALQFFCWHCMTPFLLPIAVARLEVHLHKLQKFVPNPAPCQPTGTSTLPFMQYSFRLNSWLVGTVVGCLVGTSLRTAWLPV